MTSCPAALQAQINQPLSTLETAVVKLGSVLRPPVPTLMPRSALILTGHVASSLYLLEHAIWSHTTSELEGPLDCEVFRRWVVEGGLVGAMEEVNRIDKLTEAERVRADSAIVYGLKSKL